MPARSIRILARLCALAGALWIAGAGAAQPPLHFGVFPRWNAQTMVRDFTPLAAALSRTLGREVRIETDKDFESFMRRVYVDEFDIVHLNQLQYLQAHQHGGYRAIAKLCSEASCTISALIVTRRDSGITQLSQLRGKSIAFGDRNAMVSFLLARSLLRDAGLRDKDYRSVFTHNPPNALLAAYNGVTTAAGVGSPVFEQPEIRTHVDREHMRLLAQSTAIPNLPIAVRGNMDPQLVTRIKAALLDLADQPGGRDVLHRINAARLVGADDAEYAPLARYAREDTP